MEISNLKISCDIMVNTDSDNNNSTEEGLLIDDIIEVVMQQPVNELSFKINDEVYEVGADKMCDYFDEFYNEGIDTKHTTLDSYFDTIKETKDIKQMQMKLKKYFVLRALVDIFKLN